MKTDRERYTIFEIAEYVTGWLTSPINEHNFWFDIENIEGMLANAIGQLKRRSRWN